MGWPHFIIHLLMDIWAVSPFGYCESCCYEHAHTCICLGPCFQFFWVCTLHWDCWVLWQFYVFTYFSMLIHFFFFIKLVYTHIKISNRTKGETGSVFPILCTCPHIFYMHTNYISFPVLHKWEQRYSPLGDAVSLVLSQSRPHPSPRVLLGLGLLMLALHVCTARPWTPALTVSLCLLGM